MYVFMHFLKYKYVHKLRVNRRIVRHAKLSHVSKFIETPTYNSTTAVGMCRCGVNNLQAWNLITYKQQGGGWLMTSQDARSQIHRLIYFTTEHSGNFYGGINLANEHDRN